MDQGSKGDSGPSLNGIQTELSSRPPNRIERKSKKYNNGSKEQDMIQVTQFTKLNEQSNIEKNPHHNGSSVIY